MNTEKRISKQQYEDALNIVKAYNDQLESDLMKQLSLDGNTPNGALTRIEDVDFSIRAQMCIKSLECATLGDLALLGIEGVKRGRNVGKKSFSEIEEKLQQAGLKFQ